MAALEAVHTRWGDPWNVTLDAISDHAAGVCCHREFGATLWAGVFDLGAKLAEYSFGAPCRNRLVAYEVPVGGEQRTSKQRTKE
jgi:hypothetical protein